MVKMYGVGEMATQLAGGFGVVLAYVGAAVGGAVLLMFLFLGIKAGLRAAAWAYVERIDREIAAEEGREYEPVPRR